MRKSLLVLALLAFAATAMAQRVSDLNGNHAQLYPTKDKAKDQEPGWAKPGGGGAQNLSYHGGPVIPNAHVVAIFWGPSWNVANSADNAISMELRNFFTAFGTTGEYRTILQYGVNQSSLLTGYWYDTSTPPTNVTDAAVQAEVSRYLATHTADTSAIYEVFLPKTSYSSYGNSDSCGGPNLVYCAYHSNYSHSGKDIKYASLPYPSCSGCQASGFTDANDFEHFACHETREAVTDADGNAWYDRRGNEADDKCAWSPNPFIGSGGYGYQYEWSNADSGCVKTK